MFVPWLGCRSRTREGRASRPAPLRRSSVLDDYQEPPLQPPLVEPPDVSHVRVGAPPFTFTIEKLLPDFEAATIVNEFAPAEVAPTLADFDAGTPVTIGRPVVPRSAAVRQLP